MPAAFGAGGAWVLAGWPRRCEGGKSVPFQPCLLTPSARVFCAGKWPRTRRPPQGVGVARERQVHLPCARTSHARYLSNHCHLVTFVSCEQFHMHMYTCTYVRICIYICIYAYICVYMYVYIDVYIHVYTNIYRYIYICTARATASVHVSISH